MDHADEDNRWDYDCPQFVDFTAPMPFHDGADQLFENTIMGEGPSVSQSESSSRLEVTSAGSTTNASDGRAAATAACESETPVEHKMEEAECPHTETSQKTEAVADAQGPPQETKKAPSNIVTSLEDWYSGKHASSGPDRLVGSEGPSHKKTRRSAEKAKAEMSKAAAAPKSGLMRSKSVRIPKTCSLSSLPRDKPSAVAEEGADSKPARTRTLSRGRSRSNSMNLGTPAEAKGDSKAAGKHPKIPSLLKRLGESGGSSSKLKSSEELEIERIQQLKKDLQHKRQMAQESFKKAMTRAVPMAVHSKDPTVPQEFNFHTNKRIPQPQPEKEEKSVGDFVKMLRSRTVTSAQASATSGPKKLTVPQPFHLVEKPKAQIAESKFESMAEKVKAFHRQTPDRFRVPARSRERQTKRDTRSVSPPRKLTQPHTPNLTSRSRSRPTHFLSHEQLVEKEVEELKQNQFKARPVNARILNCSSTGVRKVPSKPPTQPEEFALSAATYRKREEEEHFEFHAKPLNKKILEGPVGVKPAKPALPTVPMSPAFALKHRARIPVEVPEEAPAGNPIRAKPVPHVGIPYKPKLMHQSTVPEPFTVEERSKAMLAQRDEKIRQRLEEERRAREFHAQPLPSLEPGQGLPEKHPKEPTKLEPFELETDLRGMHYSQELAHKLEEEEEEELKARQFRAQSSSVIHREPFIPAKSSKALTVVSDFELNLDRRAVQREGFEQQKREREVELESQRRQREAARREEEEAAVAKLRAEMVHRPNPIRRYNPVVLQPSDKPLTNAESPRFSDRLRAKVRL